MTTPTAALRRLLDDTPRTLAQIREALQRRFYGDELGAALAKLCKRGEAVDEVIANPSPVGHRKLKTYRRFNPEVMCEVPMFCRSKAAPGARDMEVVAAALADLDRVQLQYRLPIDEPCLGAAWCHATHDAADQRLQP
jgi:hypothetical protein